MMTGNEIKELCKGYRASMTRAQRLRETLSCHTASADFIKEEIKCCLDKTKEVERLIASCRGLRDREVLSRRYIYGDTIEKIAEDMCYSARHIQRIINRAAEELGKNKRSE